MLVVAPPCRRELAALPENIRGDLADALARLDTGLSLAMPLSRPMPTIGRGVHELRLKDPSGPYRVVYALVRRGLIYILHTFKKTTQTTPHHHIRVAQQRLKEMPR